MAECRQKPVVSTGKQLLPFSTTSPRMFTLIWAGVGVRRKRDFWPLEGRGLSLPSLQVSQAYAHPPASTLHHTTGNGCAWWWGQGKSSCPQGEHTGYWETMAILIQHKNRKSFSNFTMHEDYLEIPSKCRFKFDRPRTQPWSLHFQIESSDTPAVGPRTTVWVSRCKERVIHRIL